MSAIARRIKASPTRTASEVWQVIVDLIAPTLDSEARMELGKITGVACNLIAEEAMWAAPIVVIGTGLRVRIYCLYGEDAVIGEAANEKPLPGDATAGNWAMSLPCPADDLSWVQDTLAKQSHRVTARDLAAPVEVEPIEDTKTSLAIDEEAFFRP